MTGFDADSLREDLTEFAQKSFARWSEQQSYRKAPSMTEHDQQLRLECLRMAAGGFSEHPNETVARAQAYYDFLTGANAMSPREAINTALDAANVK